jgi:YaiO family outer membrane protein
LGGGKYAYLSYAYSNASIISKHRAGLELYLPFPNKSETSTGVRYLNFYSGSESWIATVSYNRYIGQYLLTLRPNFIFTDSGDGQTYFASIRHFLNDANDYLILRAAAGVATERSFFQLDKSIVGEEILLLESYQVGTELRKHLSSNFIATTSLDCFKKELRFDEANFVNNWSMKTGIIYLF